MPKKAFTSREFFNAHRVDDVAIWIPRMILRTEPLQGIHFHDIEKNADVDRDLKVYKEHLTIFFEIDITKKRSSIGAPFFINQVIYSRDFFLPKKSEYRLFLIN